MGVLALPNAAMTWILDISASPKTPDTPAKPATAPTSSVVNRHLVTKVITDSFYKVARIVGPYLYAPTATTAETTAEFERLAKSALAARIENERLVDSIVYKLGKGAMAMCTQRKQPTGAYTFGCKVHTATSYGTTHPKFLIATNLINFIFSNRIMEMILGFIGIHDTWDWAQSGIKDNKITVRDVFEGSKAAAAGLKEGDTILSVKLDDGTEIIDAKKILKLMNPCNTYSKEPSLTLTVTRADGSPNAEIKLEGEQTREFPVDIEYSSNINAYAYPDFLGLFNPLIGRQITVFRVNITTGMLRLCKEVGSKEKEVGSKEAAEKDAKETTEGLIATVLGHEWTHLSQRHLEKNTPRGLLLTTIFTTAWPFFRALGMIGRLTFSLLAALVSTKMVRSFEREADYGGIFMTRHAGFEGWKKAPELWEAMAIAHPVSRLQRLLSLDGLLATHPGAAERSLNLKAAILEIDKGQPLPLEIGG